MAKSDYRCMTGYDDSTQQYVSDIQCRSGKVYGYVYSEKYMSVIQKRSRFTVLEKCFGKITLENKKSAQQWCENWLLLVNDYCTHKDQLMKEEGYVLSINVYLNYAYYHVINLNDKQRIGKGDYLFPAVSGHLYQGKGFLGFGRGEIKPEYLMQCAADGYNDFQLIAYK